MTADEVMDLVYDALIATRNGEPDAVVNVLVDRISRAVDELATRTFEPTQDSA